MSDVTDLQTIINRVRANPTAIQRAIYQKLDAISSGAYQVVDPSNPFVFLLDAAAVMTSSAMVQNEVNTRKQYASMALNYDDLYRHMSDTDYLNIFATPARTSFWIWLNKAELYRRVVPTGVGEIAKVTIPRNTEFTVAGVSFTMQYPIDVKVMAHGGLQIVYDTSKLSPLQTLQTNIVDWEIRNVGGSDFVAIQIPVGQFAIKSNYGTLNLASVFNKTYDFTDSFYYARVYYAAADGSWIEMLTTHTEQVFDATKPTAVLKVLDGQLNVSVPQTYLTNQLVNSELRIDIYTTKGPLDMILSNYIIDNFSAKWIDLDGTASSAYVAPLTAFQESLVYSDFVVSGGSLGVTFDALREQVMTNAMGAPSVPITNVQLTTRLADLGYAAVADVDNITNRQFLATRQLPAPTDGSSIAGAACSIETLQASMTELATYNQVRDNGNRITLLPAMLYQNINGVTTPVSDQVITNLMAMAVDARARTINQASYMFSPYHYVLDMNNDTFDLRAYFLDNPSIDSKVFVDENDTTGLEVGTDSYVIARTLTGYTLILTTKSSDAWKALADSAVYCQLSFVPVNEQDRAYQNGTLIGHTQAGERVYQFTLDTNYDIDELDNIVLTSFQMYTDPTRPHATALLSNFDVMYVATGIGSTVGLQSSQIDVDMGKVLLPEDAVGVARETLKLHLGDSLEGLWTASRSVASSIDYQRYTADVPNLYTVDVIARDPQSGLPIVTDDGHGGIAFTYLHRAGDPVLDTNGQPTFKYRKGDVVTDAEGNPIVVSSRQMQRQVDLFMLDGVYWFATESQALAYKLALPVQVAGWLVDDIANVSQFLLEQTSLYFFPKETLGTVNVLVGEDSETTMSAQQSFSVTYYLSGTAYRDADLRAKLTDSAISAINDQLQNATVTTNAITQALGAVVSSDVVGFEVTGLGGDTPQAAVTMKDDSQRLSIRKIAVALADGTIGIEDSVSITFLQHLQ
jgi:hypothetical protein